MDVEMTGRLQALTKNYNFTPLRYPGGKAKLAQYVKELIKLNSLADGAYVEPYAGGAGLALELLLQEHVSKIYLNDISKPVWSFWESALHQTEALCRLIRDTRITVTTWDKQKAILRKSDARDVLSLGFATFFLNRTNRSGILNGGIIGGRDQTGPWKIDARYNKHELVRRIETIAKLRSAIVVSNLDAFEFVINGVKCWPEKTLIYLDPPYYVKGRSLYLDCYSHNDHLMIANLVKSANWKQRWIVSYDDVPQIREIYHECANIRYTLNYSAREARSGSEIMFFSQGLKIPEISGAMGTCMGSAA
jgi:DNA adenine methylase